MGKREIIEDFLMTFGFTDNAMLKISGFLIGAGIKKSSEKIKIRVGENDFDFFYDFYIDMFENNEENTNQSKTVEKCVIHYIYV